MAARIDLTLDCANAKLLADFWKLALGYVDRPPPPPFTSEQDWLQHHGVPEDEWGDGAWLCDPTGAGPQLSILKVPEGKVAKNRLHMDIRVGGSGSRDERWARITAEVERLTTAGATTLWVDTDHHVVMADPEGNEFCVA